MCGQLWAHGTALIALVAAVRQLSDALCGTWNADRVRLLVAAVDKISLVAESDPLADTLYVIFRGGSNQDDGDDLPF